MKNMTDIPKEYRTSLLCIDTYDRTKLRARFYHHYENNTDIYSFSEMVDYLLYVFESVEDLRGYFEKEDSAWPTRTDIAKLKHLKNKDIDIMDIYMPRKGENATFLLEFYFSQNNSIQGRITWLEEKKSDYFRSLFELFKLIDSTVSLPETAETTEYFAG